MSTKEANFIKWFGSIAAILIAMSAAGVIKMYANDKVTQNRVINLEATHKSDMIYIRDDVKDIKTSQTIIMEDIKELLKR